MMTASLLKGLKNIHFKKIEANFRSNGFNGKINTDQDGRIVGAYHR